MNMTELVLGLFVGIVFGAFGVGLQWWVSKKLRQPYIDKMALALKPFANVGHRCNPSKDDWPQFTFSSVIYANKALVDAKASGITNVEIDE